MEPLIRHRGVVAPIRRTNIDTDQIIPKQFLKRIERTGFGQFLFYDWRFLADGAANPDFILNRPPFDRASILVAGANFGCGSSREHAPWALMDFGFRVIIAPSFADIFYQNCFQIGLLPLILEAAAVEDLMTVAESNDKGWVLTADVQNLLITDDAGSVRLPFILDSYRQETLLKGLDDIGRTLTHASEIARYESQHDVLV